MRVAAGPYPNGTIDASSARVGATLYSIIASGMFQLITTPARHTNAIPIDNGVEDTRVSCSEDAIQVNFVTRNPFTGRIFVKGMSDNPDCVESFSQGGGISTTPEMAFSFGGCNMQRSRTLAPSKGMMQSIVVIISFHPIFITKVDKAFKVQCFYMEAEKTVTSELEVSMLTTQDLGDTGRMPTCEYTVRRGSQTGEVVKFARIGEPVYHEWECDSDTHRILVKNCYVDDGQGNKYNILDENGCAIDPVILPDVTYEDQGFAKAWVEAHVFKFADRPTVFFQCTIQLCNRGEEVCDQTSPPNCHQNAAVLESAGTIFHAPSHRDAILPTTSEYPSSEKFDGIASGVVNATETGINTRIHTTSPAPDDLGANHDIHENHVNSHQNHVDGGPPLRDYASVNFADPPKLLEALHNVESESTESQLLLNQAHSTIDRLLSSASTVDQLPYSTSSEVPNVPPYLSNALADQFNSLFPSSSSVAAEGTAAQYTGVVRANSELHDSPAVIDVSIDGAVLSERRSEPISVVPNEEHKQQHQQHQQEELLRRRRRNSVPGTSIELPDRSKNREKARRNVEKRHVVDDVLILPSMRRNEGSTGMQEIDLFSNSISVMDLDEGGQNDPETRDAFESE